MKKIILVCSILPYLLSFSCNKKSDDSPDTTDILPKVLSAKIDGLFVDLSGNASCTETINNNTSSLVVKGFTFVADVTVTIELNLTNVNNTGEYNLDNISENKGSYTRLLSDGIEEYVFYMEEGNTGVVVVTELTEERIKGVFNFDCINANYSPRNVEITGGYFDLPIL